MAGNISVIEAISAASKQVDKHLSLDHAYYDLSGLLRVSSHKFASGSGKNDSDYPSFSSVLPALESMPLLGQVNHTPLPSELLQEFERVQCNSGMGLLPIINRAWLTIDNIIYMWNYENGKDLAYFDGLKEVILAVGLVIPRPDVFQDSILYLLCLTTPQEIVILGVSFTSSATDVHHEMHLIPEPLFSLPSDNVSMVSIVGTPLGRIFMSGSDGCLYEIIYQAEDGWFTKKCRKINHSLSYMSILLPSFLTFNDTDPLLQIAVDGSRHILYTRSEQMIQVYDLGRDGTKLSKVTYITMDTLRYRVCEALRDVDKGLCTRVIHIAVIPPSESCTLHLVAITQAGVRLYFTTTPGGYSQRPSLLALVHARLPPGYCPSNSASRPNNTHKAFYRKGCLLLSQTQTEDRDTVWLVDPDSFPFQHSLIELFVKYQLNGRTWAIAETIEAGELEAIDSPTSLPPAVVSQHATPPRRFILLTTNGSYMLNKLRPVDQLHSLLEVHRTADCQAVEAFFRLHGNNQACAMCLVLARSYIGEVAHWAIDAYIRFGGEPRVIFPTTLGPTQPPAGMLPQQPATPTMPQTPVPSTGLGRAVMGPEIQLSGKHDGLCLYLSRLLRPLWNNMMVQEAKDGSNQPKYYSCYDAHNLTVLNEQLLELKEFLDKHIHLFNISQQDPGFKGSPSNIHQKMLNFMRPKDIQTDSPAHVQQSMLNKYKIDALQMEYESFKNISHLVSRCCEGLSLWKLLCENQFEIVASSLEQAQKLLLKQSSFKAFATGENKLPAALITSLLSIHAGNSAMTDELLARLRKLAPSLFSQEDAIVSKAQELVTIAMAIQSPMEKINILRESLKRFSQVTEQIDLSGICMQYQNMQYYEGVVELCLCTALNKDKHNLALHYYKSYQPLEDVAGQQALCVRQEAYAVVTGTLGTLLSQARTPLPSSIPSKPGAVSPQDNTTTQPDPMKDFNVMLALALRSDDELFHVTLYSWLLSDTVNMGDKLIEIQSPYVEDYLKYMCTLQDDPIPIFDLLWKFYEKNKKYHAAAKILDHLAHKDSTDLKLDKRLEFMSRAVICAKSTNIAKDKAEGEFLYELEEKMEVARIQLSVLEAMTNLPLNPHTQIAIAKLNSELLDISTLYSDFAEPHDLPECKLAIVHCGGHYDPVLIESLWRGIIEQEIQRSLNLTKHEIMKGMSDKMIYLSQFYAKSERYFPIPFLVKLLEQHCCQYHWTHGFVSEMFIKMGVSYTTLFNIYNRLFNEKDPFWDEADAPLHVLSVISIFLTNFTKNPSVVSQHERPSFTNAVSSSIAKYLVELQTLDPSIPQLQTITNSLRNLKRQLP